MSLSDLAKYSMTRSVARSLCDSWASCLCRVQTSSDRHNSWHLTGGSTIYNELTILLPTTTTASVWLLQLITCCLFMTWQIFFYSKSIFMDAKIPAAYVPYAVIGTNAVNVVMTFIAVGDYEYSQSSSGVARNLIWGVYVLTSHCNFKTCVNVPHVNKTVTDFFWGVYIPIYPPPRRYAPGV